VNLPARAAAIRGDDYQHAIAWYWVCRALDDPNIDSVSIEDPSGGHFDDVVIRHRTGPDIYWQVKSSNYGNVVVDEAWLTTTGTGANRTPLQHFYATWNSLCASGRPFELGLVTNRGFDNAHPLLGGLRDLKSESLAVDKLRDAGRRSKIGLARSRWAAHLGIPETDLLEFLAAVRWKTGGAESDWDRQSSHLMRLAGLLADAQAVTVGKAMVRGWVTDGAGPQTRDDIHRQVASRGLLARAGTLVFAVHAIDRQPTLTPANVEVDFVELYDGVDPFSRVQLRDPADWKSRVTPALQSAARDLETFATRRVHVIGSMRLPLWFAVGRMLPDVRGWVLSLDQRADEWRTDVAPQQVTPRVLAEIEIAAGTDLALAIGLAHDPTRDVEHYVRETGHPIGGLLVLGPETEPGPHAVPNANWAVGWVRAARERARRAVAEINAQRVHLFMACPAGVALVLGHQWNLMPRTTVYEHLRPGYAPTITVA
jgi:hypothetical protein